MENKLNITRWTDEDGWRIYEVDGKKFISVTQVLSYFVDHRLKSWFIKTSPKAIEKKQEATAKPGSDIHARASQGKEERLNKLLSEMKAEVINTEFFVVSPHGWGGQVDLLVRMNGKNYVIDIKTGRFGDVGSQLGAYSLACTAMGIRVDGIGCISLPRDETEEAKYFNYTDYPGSPTMDDHQYFWCCGFDKFKGHYYKKLKDYPWYGTKTVLEYIWR